MSASPVRRMVLAVDLSDASKVVIQQGVAFARQLGCSIDLVHVREPFVYPVTGGFAPASDQERVLIDWIDASLVALADGIVAAGISCVTTSLHGSAAAEIVGHAHRSGADLVAVGSHGHGGIAHAVLGRVAERVVHRAACPVLVVPVPR